MSETLADQLLRHEALRLRMYKCPAGKWTIGVGHNIEDRGISRNIAWQILSEDIEEVRRELWRMYPDLVTLPDDAKQVLENMAFNMGTPRLATFKKMFAALRARDYAKAADEMLDSAWAKQVGDAPGQRADELSLMMRGCK